jgi:hypothetical protein
MKIRLRQLIIIIMENRGLEPLISSMQIGRSAKLGLLPYISVSIWRLLGRPAVEKNLPSEYSTMIVIIRIVCT